MPNNLGVSVSADVTDLQVKFSVAKAETNALTSEMNKLAKQSAAGIIDPAGQARLQEVAGDLIKARAETAALSAEMKEMTSATEGVGGVLGDLKEKLSTAFEVTGVAVAIEAVEKLGEMIESLGERATTIRTTSDVLAITGEQFQAMEMAAEEAGVGVDTLTRAAEKMNVTLFEARQGSSAAIEKMLSLGVTTQQLHDPTFKINELFQTLHERLTNTATSQQTMNELMKDLGPRAALAAEAIKKYDGSAEAVKEVMNAINGLTDEQTQKLQEAKAWWGELGSSVSNTASKIFVAMTNMLPHTTGTGVIGKMIEQENAEAREGAQEQQDLNKEVLQQEMENSKAGIAAYKDGTAERLQQLRIYAAAAQQYYGSDNVDAVVKANQEIIAAQRSYEDQQKSATQRQKAQLQELEDFGKALNDEIMVDRQRLALESAKIESNRVKEEEKDGHELYDEWESTYTEITNKHAEMLHRQAADAQRNAKEEAKSWQGMVGEIENAESSMINNILTGRKGLGASLIQLSGQIITSEIANDVKAVTTRMLLHNTAAAQQKALEQGGLLYHLLTSSHATAADIANHARQTTTAVSSQAAQTSAVTSGNAARAAATASAQAAGQAQAAAIGPATVMGDAAKAAAGTFASVAQIPYVGWALAPEAAAAAFAAVSAYAPLASLATGTNYVPRDMMANIHEGEAVVPKQYNPAANPGAAVGGGYSEEHNYHGDLHVSALDAPSFARMLNKPAYRNAAMASAMRAFRRGAR